MNNWQFVLALTIPTVIPTTAVFIAALLGNSRLSDLRDDFKDFKKETSQRLTAIEKKLDEIGQRRLV